MKKKILTMVLAAAMVLQGIGMPTKVMATAGTLPAESSAGENSENVNEPDTALSGEQSTSEDETGTKVETGESTENAPDISSQEVSETEPATAESTTGSIEETLPEATMETEGGDLSWSQWILGNSGANILGGGRLAEAADGTLFYSNEGENSLNYYDSDGKAIAAVAEDATNLNVFDDAVYYISGGHQIEKWERSSGDVDLVLDWSAEIRQMYVVNEEVFYFLSEGNLYGFCPGGEVMLLREDGGICGFIPTQYGMLYSKGEVLNWTIWAENNPIQDGVGSWDFYDEYLILSVDGEDYQIEASHLFGGYRSSLRMESYSLGATYSLEELFPEDGDCDVCENNAQMLSLDRFSANNYPVNTAAVSAASSVSTGQRNIIKRARQQAEIAWTPLADINGWGSNRTVYTFKKGTTYYGIPYGQPVTSGKHAGRYIPFDTSDPEMPDPNALQEFADAVSNSGSKMYTAKATYGFDAPYYSSDCSAFVSYAWGIQRLTTSLLPIKATKVENQSVYSVQLGDIFNKSGSHTVLVADIGYHSDGSVQYVDILQQTPPKIIRTRYGGGSGNTLADLEQKYLKSGYTLYRYNNRDSVKYTHSCASPIDGDYCDNCMEDYTLGGFVKRLYRLILGRTAAQKEVDYWKDLMESGQKTGVEVAYGFIFSQEYINKNVNSNDYITVLYRTMMGRYPGDSEITYWREFLESGFTRYKIFAGFANSVEFLDICNQYGIKRGSYTSTAYVDQHEQVTLFVARLYHICLLRNPSTTEVEYWVKRLVNGTQGGGDVAYGFFFSEEFLGKKYSNEKYVRFLYATFLDRNPDQVGLNDWIGRLERGQSRKKVFDGFVWSVEFRDICKSYGINQ